MIHKSKTALFSLLAFIHIDALTRFMTRRCALILLYHGVSPEYDRGTLLNYRKKFISPDYMHVDGTSFAAPIVSSVAAQMLEANPTLTAGEIRNILLQTAAPLATYDITRQGYGRLQPKVAVYAAMERKPASFT